MENVAEVVRALRDDDRRAALVRAITLEGFGSRRAGETAVVAADGSIDGRVLGGGVDDVVRDEAAALLAGDPASRVVDVRLGDGPAVAAGLACGGSARLLIQDTALIPDAWWESIAARRPAALITDLRGGVSRVLTTEGEGRRADAPDGSRRVLLTEGAGARAGELLARRSPATEVAGDDVIEVWWPTPRILVLGAAELAGAIGRQAALLGWEPVLDDGGDPGASAAASAALGPSDALVVLSHAPEVAIPSLRRALRGEAGYVGALGSRTTQANRRTRLLASGLDDADVDRIHGPVGLDLGPRTPEETAVAICAEIIAHRSGRSATSLREGRGPING
jgi:xanthine dehydrogenase accessory factor